MTPRRRPLLHFLALFCILFALPCHAQEQAIEELPMDDDDLFAVIESLPPPPKPKIMTRALDPALAAVAQQVDQVTTMANRYRREGEFQKAEESLAHFPPEKASDLDDYSRLALAGANFNLGMTYLKRQHYDEAVSAFKRASLLDTADAKTAYCLGTAYRKQKHYDSAVIELQRAVELNPDMAPAYFSLGNAYLRLGKTDKAREAYQQAIEKDPRHVAAHFMLGSLAWKKSNWEAAATAWQKVLEINPHHTKAKTWLAKARAKI